MKESYKIAVASIAGITGFLYGSTLHLPSEMEQLENIKACAETLTPEIQTKPVSEECLPYLTVVSLGGIKLFTLQPGESKGSFLTEDDRPVYQQPPAEEFSEVAINERTSNSTQIRKKRVNEALIAFLFGGITYLAADAKRYKESEIENPLPLENKKS